MLLVRISALAAMGLLACATLSGCGPAGINGSVEVPAGATAEGATTINGSVNVGDGAKVGATATVNGGVRIGENVTAESAKTVNGGIHIGNGTRISRDVDTVNGGIRLNSSHVGGGITTYNGDIEVGRGSRVEGGITVERPEFSNDLTKNIPRVVIGPDSVVQGTLKFHREVKLFVNDTAKIGPVEGATPQLYSGDDTNNPSASTAAPPTDAATAAADAPAPAPAEKPAQKPAAGGPEK